ncbi:MAG: hypothetical protein OEM97_01995 [Acidimicrobiia bacterium]|nr:hypothetical protein [Acidimicrobiia bacterium]
MSIVLVLVAGLVIPVAAPALAQSLEEWLERAADAEFEGRQVTICDTPDGRLTEAVDVAQQNRVIVVRALGGEVVIRSGSVMTTGVDGATSISSVDSSSSALLADRYSSEVRGRSTVINRAVDLVEVLEGDLVRVRYAFDLNTGAVLRSDVNNGDGSLYCTTQFVEFRPNADIAVAEPSTTRELLLTALSSDVSLPTEVAGFAQLDMYEGPQGSTAAFYSDGIFSFTVIVADRKIAVSDLSDAPQVKVHDRDYVRRFSAGQVLFSWESADGGLVMIGDLPLDLQGAVLDGLPQPGATGFLLRMWRLIFR